VPEVLAVTPGSARFLLEVGLVLLLLAVLARVAVRTGFSPIPLYLLAGLGIGYVAPRTLDPLLVSVESLLAVILLLFILGLEYTAEDVVGSLRSHLGAGVADLVLNFPPGFAAALLLGWGILPALVLGGVTYVSSSGIVAKVLDDFGRLGNAETPSVLSMLVTEDLAMAPYLPLLAVLLAHGSAWRGILLAIAAVALAVLALAFARRHGHVLSRGLSHPKSEVVLLTVMGLLLLVGGAAELFSVSSAVVAFLVGLSISGSLAARARELLSPLRDVFAAIFFVLFGIEIDVAAIPHVLGAAAILLVVTAATKMATGWIAARRSSGVPGRLRAGTALVAHGEFSIVIAGLGVAAGVEAALAPLAATYVLFTAIGGPLLTRYADPLGRWYMRRSARRRAGNAPHAGDTRQAGDAQEAPAPDVTRRAAP
jgi:monovalent cation:H+ antiporter-2, CPA2 family